MTCPIRYCLPVVFFLLVTENTSFPDTVSPWPMFRHDPQHTGSSSYAGSKEGILKWCFRTNGEVNSSPAIGEDGTIYVGSLDGSIYAVTPDGKLKWNYSLDDRVYSSPALDGVGNVYVCSWGGKVISLDPT